MITIKTKANLIKPVRFLYLPNEIKESFDIAGDDYISSDFQWGDDTDILLEEVKRHFNNKVKLFYLGSGPGLLLHKISLSKLFNKIVANEFSNNMLNISRRLNSVDITFINKDFFHLGTDDYQCDVCICLNNTLGNMISDYNIPVISRELALKKIKKITTINGLIFISVYNSNYYTPSEYYSKFLRLNQNLSKVSKLDFYLNFKKNNNPSHLFYSHWFFESEIVSLFSKYFTILRIVKREKRIIVIAKNS